MCSEVLNNILLTFNENTNSHAFLIESNNQKAALQDILRLIGQINSIDNTKLENCADVKIVFPDGKEIKKNQISNIILDFQTFPVLLKHKYYIIVNSETMNLAAANVLLKFLEEPQNDVIGFFVTSNRVAVINTIVSRCQFLKLNDYIIKGEEKDYKDFIDQMGKMTKFDKLEYVSNYFSSDRPTLIKELSSLEQYLINNHLIENIWNIKLLEECIKILRKNGNQDLVILNLVRKWK